MKPSHHGPAAARRRPRAERPAPHVPAEPGSQPGDGAPATRQPLLTDRYSVITQAEIDALTGRVINIISYYKPLLGLAAWGVYVVATRLEENKAEVQCWPEYREAEITVNPYRLEHVDETELEETVVHELGHVLVSRFIDDWKHAGKKKHRKLLEEGLVSDVTGALLRVARAVTGEGDAD